MHRAFAACTVTVLTVLSLLFGNDVACLAPLNTQAQVSTASREPSPRQRHKEIARIIHVLERELGSDAVTDGIRDKLLEMDAAGLTLACSLCDRIDHAANREGAETALLLVTSLIILSWRETRPFFTLLRAWQAEAGGCRGAEFPEPLIVIV